MGWQQNKLKLHGDTIESLQQEMTIWPTTIWLPKTTNVSEVNVPFARSVRILGLIVTADEQDISLCQSAYRLWEISTIGRFLSRQTANFLVRAFVLSKHNYYNSLSLNYLHTFTNIEKYRILLHVGFSELKKKSNKQMDHVTPLLCSLHWLHVSARI